MTLNARAALMGPLFTPPRRDDYLAAGDLHYEPGPQFLCLNELPRMPSSAPFLSLSSPSSSSPPSSSTTSLPPPPPPPPPRRPSPFLRLPAEIRLQIYSLLVLPRRPTDLLPSNERLMSSSRDYFDYDEKTRFGVDRGGATHPAPSTTTWSRPPLLIRTIDPDWYGQRYPHARPLPARTKYTVRCRTRARAACRDTTYHCVNVPRIEDQLAILRTNKQIHAECAEILYGSYTFDFDTHVEAIVPFLSDLTPFARSRIRSVRLVKRAWAYEKECDRYEWSNALRYLTAASTGIALRRLELGIVAGRPGGQHGWDRIPTYSAQDVQLLKDTEGYGWMQYLLEFQGLHELDVHAIVERCPPATISHAMAGYVRFSASVESGFQAFLREQLVGA